MPAVFVAFERSYEGVVRKIVRQLSGPYVHVEMVVTPETTQRPAAYTSYMGERFSKNHVCLSDESHDFLRIDVDAAEYDKLWRTCEALVLCKIPYNTTDVILSIVPLRSPVDRPLDKCKSLFCSQAMVLILRSCLEKDHAVAGALNGVNSRVVSPTALFDLLLPHAKQVQRRELVDAAPSAQAMIGLPQLSATGARGSEPCAGGARSPPPLPR
jgi:hypothetical protein